MAAVNRLIWSLLAASLMALCLTGVWSAAVYERESRHTGEPLPVRTLSQVIAAPLPPADVHLQGAVPAFANQWVDDHYCHKYHCLDRFIPLLTPGARPGAPTELLSRIRSFPGDVNERRHPFDPLDPVIEGRVDPDGLRPREITALQARGIQVSARTVVFERQALHGRVPPADSVDVTLPWLIGVPVALVSGLMAFSVSRRRDVWSAYFRRQGKLPL